MSQLKCGAAERIITPSIDKEYNMPGYYHERIAEEVINDIKTNVIVIDDGEKKIVLVSMDLLDARETLVHRMRNRISERFGIAGDNVLVAATHAHTGSIAAQDDTVISRREADIVIDRTLEAVEEAISKMVNVTVSFAAKEFEGLNFNRVFLMKDGSYRSNPRGERIKEIVSESDPFDKTLHLLAFKDENGKVVAQAVNLACHADSVGENKYCADYPGEVRDYTKAKFGDDVVTVFLLGCCGNVVNESIEDIYTNNRRGYKGTGKNVFNALCELYGELKTYKDPTVKVVSRKFLEKRRQPTDEEIQNAKAVMSTPLSRYIDVYYAKEVLYMKKNYKESELLEIQAIKIGDCYITTVPCEAWSTIGLGIKAGTDKTDVMVTSQANGFHSYIATDPAYSGGIYEAKLTNKRCFGPAAAQHFIDITTDILKKI